MIRVTIPSDKPDRDYEFKGQRYAEQAAAIHTGGHFPLPFHVTTKLGESYPKGEYTLDPNSFAINERGKLGLKSVRLLPLNGASK